MGWSTKRLIASEQTGSTGGSAYRIFHWAKAMCCFVGGPWSLRRDALHEAGCERPEVGITSAK